VTTPDTRIPALVVSGFLGAGKTTLVRALLDDARREGLVTAVVSNEFGELGIDGALLGDLGDGYVELEGGCVCCRLSDDLVHTLQRLWEEVRPDRVIVETSGLALPYEVQINFWREPVSSWAEDALAAVVVDAEQLCDAAELDATFRQQISSADLLLLSKVDRVDPADIPRLEARLREIEPDAPLVHTVRGDVPSALLFPPRADRVRSLAAAPDDHEHETFASEIRAIAPGVDESGLKRELLAAAALRIKGFVETDRGLRLVQGVGPRIELVDPGIAPPRELVGKLVLIRRA